ncbi:MAG: HEAT repeat domain-containing protein [Candidatus Heimdallarchaeaceae archaeon]
MKIMQNQSETNQKNKPLPKDKKSQQEEIINQMDSRKDPVLEHLMEKEKRKMIERKADSNKRVNQILSELPFVKVNRKKLALLQELSDYTHFKEVKRALIDIAKFDSYKMARVKAISLLSEQLKDPEVQNLFLRKLDDNSPDVRMWTVWGLKDIAHKEEVQNALLRELRFQEKSNKVKLWIIKILNDHLDKKEVQEAFLYLLKTNPNNSTRKLLVSYLLTRIDNKEIAYALATHLHTEKNKDIKKEIIEKLITSTDEDIQYSLMKLLRTEKNEEIRMLIKVEK